MQLNALPDSSRTSSRGLVSSRTGQLADAVAPYIRCGQMAECIKMLLCMELGLGPGHIVLDGDPVPPPLKGHSPQFLDHICCGQMARRIKMPLGKEVGLSPSDIVLDGDLASPLPKEGRASPNFRPWLLWTNGWMDEEKN